MFKKPLNEDSQAGPWGTTQAQTSAGMGPRPPSSLLALSCAKQGVQSCGVHGKPSSTYQPLKSRRQHPVIVRVLPLQAAVEYDSLQLHCVLKAGLSHGMTGCQRGKVSVRDTEGTQRSRAMAGPSFLCCLLWSIGLSMSLRPPTFSSLTVPDHL